MVHRQNKPSPLVWLAILVIPVCAVLTFCILTFLPKNTADLSEQIEEPPVNDTIQKPDFIDLQPLVDKWVKKTTGEASIIIYDLNNQRLAASYNPSQIFETASLYKLFIVYEGYLEVENGSLDPSAIVTGGHTVKECLDLAIRESDSPCAEGLHAMIGQKKITEALTDWGLTNTSLDDYQSTAEDVFKIMQKYYEHTDLSEETWTIIQDSMLNQPSVDSELCDGSCDWRQGLPSGFSVASVYNKVGWEHSGYGNIWNLYHDAAIVEFPTIKPNIEARKYIVVVMTSKVPLSNIVEFGKTLEQTILEAS